MLVAMIAIDAINGRLWLNDLRVYWEASGHFLRGEVVYGSSFGLESGFYKYAPIGLLVFAPLAVLPFELAAILFALVIGVAIVIGIAFADRLVRNSVVQDAPLREAVPYLALLITAVHFHREIHLGNVNMLLLLALLSAIDRSVKGNGRIAGLLFGFALLMKPHFVVLLPLLLLHRKWREVASAMITIVCGILLPPLLLGWQDGVAIHRDWLHAMATHNASVFYTGSGSKMATDTLYTVIWRASGGAFPATMSTALVLLAIVAFSSFAYDRWLARTGDARRNFTMLALLLIAAVPSLTPTDTEHFLFSMPLVVFLLRALFGKAKPAWLPIVAIPILLAYGGNWQDPLGDLSGWLADNGVLGAANMLLVVLCAWFFAAHQKHTAA